MKRFLPLLILTGFVFGQDVLTHKSGKIYKGKYYGIVEQNIVFYVEGETGNKMFPIKEVTSIETSNGMLSYPFGTKPLSIEEKAIYDANLYDLKDWVNREEIFYFHKSIQYMTASEKEIYMQAYSKRLKGRKINHIVGCTIVTGAGCWLLAGLLMESFYRAW
jgi:hypothetical protein